MLFLSDIYSEVEVTYNIISACSLVVKMELLRDEYQINDRIYGGGGSEQSTLWIRFDPFDHILLLCTYVPFVFM